MSHLSTGQAKAEKDPTRKRSFSLRTFCDRNDVGLTTAYAEIKAGRLIAHKVGARTLVFGLVVEVKGRKNGAEFTTLEKWLGEYDALFLRRSHADPIIVLTLARVGSIS